MLRVDPAVEQVEAEPAAFILMPGLVQQRRRGEGLAEILGLEEPGIRNGPANGPHRLQGSSAFVDERAKEGGIVVTVRIPMAVEAGESRGGQRLVDRGPHL